MSSNPFKKYKKNAISEMRNYVVGEDLDGQKITVDPNDAKKYGCPKAGDMVARNPSDHTNQWLMPAEFFKNYDPAE